MVVVMHFASVMAADWDRGTWWATCHTCIPQPFFNEEPLPKEAAQALVEQHERDTVDMLADIPGPDAYRYIPAED
jgi:hypothetical protein